jgi:hypothetical protein
MFTESKAAGVAVAQIQDRAAFDLVNIQDPTFDISFEAARSAKTARCLRLRSWHNGVDEIASSDR